MSLDHDPAEMARAMKRLRIALQARIRQDERRERRAGAPARKRKADGGLVEYDTKGLGLLLRPALEWDGRGWRAIAAEIGVTAPDLSRIMAGQDIAAQKIFAICDWLRIDPRRFYRPLRGTRPVFRGPKPPATGQGCFTGKALKQTSGLTPEGLRPLDPTSGGRDNSRDGRSALRASPEDGAPAAGGGDG